MPEFKKPILAVDANLDKVKFPCYVMPKIDGVRGLNVDGKLVGRSLKAHKNRATSAHFSQRFLSGCDGELVLNNRVTSPSLCRDTTSAINTHELEPVIYWHLFDKFDELNPDAPYSERLAKLNEFVNIINEDAAYEFTRLSVVKHYVANSKDEVLSYYNKFIDMGYEGIIIRDPNGKHKNGRCTVNEANYLRIKPTADREAEVIGVIEGFHNANEAETNELGLTSRSSHKENKIPNGMVGALLCKNEFYSEPFKVSAGCLTHEQRIHYLAHPENIIGNTIKYKFMAHGEKDAPRHARFHSFRAETDIG